MNLTDTALEELVSLLSDYTSLDPQFAELANWLDDIRVSGKTVQVGFRVVIHE